MSLWRRLVEYLQPEIIVGVGAYAEGRAKEALAGMDIRIGRVLHQVRQVQ